MTIIACCPRRRNKTTPERRRGPKRYYERLLVDNNKDRRMGTAFLVVHDCTCTIEGSMGRMATLQSS